MNQNHENILIISPEIWEVSKLSKHHYALAFAEKGFNVYFMSPNTSFSRKNNESCPEHAKIQLIYFSFSKTLDSLRFHLRPLYNFILKYKIRRWLKDYPNFDYVISFDCNGVFTELSNFEAKKTIFFPADQVNEIYRKEYQGFDYLVSISPVILEAFPQGKNKILLHHGLSPNFIIENENSNFLPSKNVARVAYVGNLLIGPILDKSKLIALIKSNPEIEFHFYGAYKNMSNNMGADSSSDTLEFVDFLMNAKNCVLHGTVSSDTLSKQLQNQDAFLICYDYNFDKNKCSNSHKIMEYLATGKPIISTRISMYDGLNLFPMLDTFDNSNFPEFFDYQMENWDAINTQDAFIKRKEFAFENSYTFKVDHILNLIGTNNN